MGKITGSDGLKNDMYYWSSTERNNTSIFGVQLTSSGSTKVDGLKYDQSWTNAPDMYLLFCIYEVRK